MTLLYYSEVGEDSEEFDLHPQCVDHLKAFMDDSFNGVYLAEVCLDIESPAYIVCRGKDLLIELIERFGAWDDLAIYECTSYQDATQLMQDLSENSSVGCEYEGE